MKIIKLINYNKAKIPLNMCALHNPIIQKY